MSEYRGAKAGATDLDKEQVSTLSERIWVDLRRYVDTHCTSTTYYAAIGTRIGAHREKASGLV